MLNANKSFFYTSCFLNTVLKIDLKKTVHASSPLMAARLKDFNIDKTQGALRVWASGASLKTLSVDALPCFPFSSEVTGSSKPSGRLQDAGFLNGQSDYLPC